MGTWYIGTSQPLLKENIEDIKRFNENLQTLHSEERVREIKTIEIGSYRCIVVLFKEMQNVCPEELIKSRTDLSWSWITDEQTGGYIE